MAATVDGLRTYLRLSEDDTEDLTLYLEAARAKAAAAGIPDFVHNPHYDLFLYALAGMYYENRSFGFASSSQAAERNARNLINSFVLELRYSKEPGGGAE
ncbi:MAG: hypothetical protein HFE97_04230 [Oscillospiraceae bacterium]|nr:hypothetical protein [Oscillospiraceae bacterium]